MSSVSTLSTRELAMILCWGGNIWSWQALPTHSLTTCVAATMTAHYNSFSHHEAEKPIITVQLLSSWPGRAEPLAYAVAEQSSHK